MMRFLYLLCVSLWSLSSLAQEDVALLFENGNQAYADGNYQLAIDTYSAILDNDLESAALYFNLANAHYKLNNIAPSIYYYEKAKQLAPLDQDIEDNAAFAANMKIDAIDTLPKNTLQEWVDSLINLQSFNAWAITAIAFSFLFVLLFLGYYFSYVSYRKRLFFVSAMLGLLFMLSSLGFAYAAFAKAQNDKPAIVFAVETEVKSEPNMSSDLAFTLHEGTKVMVLESVQEWKRIKIEDGKTGWIPASDIKEL